MRILYKRLRMGAPCCAVKLHVEAEACVAKEELRATREELLKSQSQVVRPPCTHVSPSINAWPLLLPLSLESFHMRSGMGQANLSTFRMIRCESYHACCGVWPGVKAVALEFLTCGSFWSALIRGRHPAIIGLIRGMLRKHLVSLYTAKLTLMVGSVPYNGAIRVLCPVHQHNLAVEDGWVSRISRS